MNQNIGRDALNITLSRIITLTFSLITAMILSRHLSLVDYGTYSQIILILEFSSILFIIGLPSSINYYAAKDESMDFRQNFFSTYYTLSTILSILAGISLFIVFPFIATYFKNPLLENFLYIIVILPWVRITTSSMSNFLIVYRKTNLLFIYQSAHSISLAALIIIVRMLDMQFYTYMLIYLILEIIFTIIFYGLIRVIVGNIQVRIDGKIVREIFKFSLPIGLSSVVATISIQLDKMIIARFFSIEELAVYANASRELPLTFVAASITAVLLPFIVKKIALNDNKGVIKLWGDASILSYSIICLFVSILVVFAPVVINILYSDKFISGVSVFRVYSLVLLLRFTYFGMILNATGRTRIILYSSLLSLIMNIILNIALYYTLGFIGPSIATFISMIIIIIWQLHLTKNIMRCSFSEIMPWKELIHITLINLTLAIISYIFYYRIFNNLNINYIIKFVIIILGWVSIYALIIGKKMFAVWKNLNTAN